MLEDDVDSIINDGGVDLLSFNTIHPLLLKFEGPELHTTGCNGTSQRPSWATLGAVAMFFFFL